MVLHCAILLIIYSFYNIKFYSGQKTSIQWFVGADPVNAKRWEFFLTQFSIWGVGGLETKNGTNSQFVLNMFK